MRTARGRRRARSVPHRFGTPSWLLGWILVAMLVLPEAATAQLVRGFPNSIELRPSASLPIGDFGRGSPGFEAGRGVGVAVAVHFPLMSYLAAYGSYDYERFQCGACGAAGFEDRLPEAGFEAGLEALLSARSDRIAPWLSAGVLIHRRLEIPDGGDGFASKPATGWSAAAGLLVRIASSVSLRPGIRYRTYSATFVFPDLGFDLLGESGSFERQANVTSVSLELGFSFNLPYES